MHLFFGTMMFTNEKLIPAVSFSDTFGSYYSEDLMAAYSLAENAKLSGISYSAHSAIYFAVFVIFTAVPLILIFIRYFLQGIWNILTSCCNSDTEDAGQAEAFRSKNLFCELSLSNLKKIYDRSKKEINEFKNGGKLWILHPKFQINEEPFLSNFEIRQYENKLKDRMRHIMETINDHMELLMRDIKRRKPAIYRRFMDKTYDEKLKVLQHPRNLKYFKYCIDKGKASVADRLRLRGTT